VHGPHQIARLELAVHQVSPGAETQHLGDDLRLVGAGQHQDSRMPAEGGDHRQTVGDRHPVIEQRDGRAQPLGQVERLPPVRRLGHHPEPLVSGENAPEDGSHDRVVVDHEHVDRRRHGPHHRAPIERR
jgi:hypothetical protein